MSDYPHWYTDKIRWGDMDALGHVNNAVFFVFCESARMDLFRAVQLDQFTDGGRLGPALVTASCEFKQQLHYPATLDVGVRVARIGTKSFTLDYGLFHAGQRTDPVGLGSSVVVWVDYAASQSQPIPDALRTALTALQVQ